MSARCALFLQITEPGAYPPIINASALLCEAGWQVHVLSSPIADKSIRMPPMTGMTVHSTAARPTHAIGKLDLLRYVWATLLIARQIKPTLIYASDSFSTVPALLVAAWSGARLIYHEHDSPNHPTELHPLVRLCRHWVFRRAATVIIPNAVRAAQVQAQSAVAPDKLKVVWNVPRLSESRPNAAKTDGPLIVYYHGSINSARLPVAVAEVVAGFSGAVLLHVAGYEAPGAKGHLQLLRDKGVDVQGRPCVIALGEFVHRDELLECARQAHVGLCFMPMHSTDINMAAMVGASNKAFDYLAVGLGLIVSDRPEWVDLFVRGGYAQACDPDDAKSLRSALQWYLDNRAQLSQSGERGRRKILDDWHYEKAFAPVLKDLSQS